MVVINCCHLQLENTEAHVASRLATKYEANADTHTCKHNSLGVIQQLVYCCSEGKFSLAEQNFVATST
jgi:hypothetical protein